jgi:hypothetical protein
MILNFEGQAEGAETDTVIDQIIGKLAEDALAKSRDRRGGTTSPRMVVVNHALPTDVPFPPTSEAPSRCDWLRECEQVRVVHARPAMPVTP